MNSDIRSMEIHQSSYQSRQELTGPYLDESHAASSDTSSKRLRDYMIDESTHKRLRTSLVDGESELSIPYVWPVVEVPPLRNRIGTGRKTYYENEGIRAVGAVRSSDWQQLAVGAQVIITDDTEMALDTEEKAEQKICYGSVRTT